MEKSLFRKNIEQGKNTLEDLYSLSTPSLYPLIERLNYHFSEIEVSHSKEKEFYGKLLKSNERPVLKNLNRAFKRELDNKISDFFRNLTKAVKFDVVNAIENPSLEQLDQILESFPLVSEASRLFQFQDEISLWLYNDCFSLTGNIAVDLDLETLRDKAYEITRKLFAQKVLLTFEIFEASTEGRFQIKFLCHLKYSDNNDLRLRLPNNNVLRTSGMSVNFLRPIKDLKTLGKHQVFLLNQDLEASLLKEADIDKISKEKKWVLFHFPFLFRPLSLIINVNPDGGSALFDGNEVDQNGGVMPSVIDFDIFSIIQK